MRIRKYFEEYPGMTFEIEELSGFMRVTIILSPITPPITPPISDLEKKVLALLKKHPSISFTGLGKQLAISRDTAKEYVNKLKEKNVVKRVGPARGGHWEVVSSEEW